MVIPAACPDPALIRDLLNGNLSEAKQSELSSHFDLCPTCQQQFDTEAAGPRFLGDVARLCSDSDWQQNTPTLDRLIRDIPQQLSDAADEASVATWSTEAVADFLDASENADHIGRLGTYEIVEVIGRGGMGIVLRGIDSRLNRVVAIKVLAPELASNPNARRRFYREGQAAAAVSHDHVVTIHAVDDHERLPYLVMEFVAGESLEECIRRTGPLPLESVLRMGRQAALGLAAAHEVGLVHRDMKPANILLENGIQRVRITDFGLARATDDVSITQTGTVSGTPLYMSPEQAGGETVDHRSDLFSLGSVFYAMCTGRPAFRAQTTLAVIKRVCEDTPRPIREVNPDIPPWLADIINRLMAKQPDERIQSAAELAELLGSHLAHLQDPYNVPAPAGAGAKPAPERRTLKSLILAVLLIGGIGMGITEAAGVTDVGKLLEIALRLKTPEGTLVIEIEDPDVEVSVDGSEVILSGITQQELRLKPGKYQYRATRKGEPAESDWVTIERDGKTVVRIRQLPPEHSVEVTPEPNGTTATNPITTNPPATNLTDPLGPSTDESPEAKSDDLFVQTATARRMWALVPLFERKEQLEAVTVYCAEIARRFPASEFAKPAAEKLAELEQQGYFGFVPFSTADFRLWYLAVSNEEKGRQDIAIMLCHELLLSYADSRCAARAQQKYDELKDTPKGAEGLAEVFMAYALSFQANGNARLAQKMRQRIATKFPTTIIGQAMGVLTHGNSGLSSKAPAVGSQPSGGDALTGTLDEAGYATDGIRLLSRVRVRRFVPDQLAPVWFGKWYFKQIPEQLYGQNFAFVSRDGGLLEFDVADVNGRKLTQRIWLLIPHQNWDGSRTTSIPEDLDPSVKFATRESLLAFGWTAWNDITGEHIRVTPDQPVKHMKWSVFYRDAKPGERYRVRTHWKHTPMLVWGSTQLDNVVMEPEWDQRVAVFGPGAKVPHGNGDLVFDHAPEAVDGRLFTKRNGYQGAARFRVRSDQKVTVAMYEWGHEHEGNASGDWMSELTSRRKMAERGWQEAGEVASRHTNPMLPGVSWFIYTRDCTAGESFVLRNHKYQAPIVFSEKKYRDVGPVDVKLSRLDQHAHRQQEERLATIVDEFNAMIKQRRFAEANAIAQKAKREFRHTATADKLLQIVSLAKSASVENPDAFIDKGLIGRMMIHEDIGEQAGSGTRTRSVDPHYLFHYQQGLVFSREQLPLDLIADNRFVVRLEGTLQVPRDMVVRIYQAGGGVSHDVSTLFVNYQKLGSVGDDREKQSTYEIPLAKGFHHVRWELSGGTFRSNLLAFIDPENDELLPLRNAGADSIRQTPDDRIVRIHSTKLDWPLEAELLPLPIQQLHHRKQQHFLDEPAKRSPQKPDSDEGF